MVTCKYQGDAVFVFQSSHLLGLLGKREETKVLSPKTCCLHLLARGASVDLVVNVDLTEVLLVVRETLHLKHPDLQGVLCSPAKQSDQNKFWNFCDQFRRYFGYLQSFPTIVWDICNQFQAYFGIFAIDSNHILEYLRSIPTCGPQLVEESS